MNGGDASGEFTTSEAGPWPAFADLLAATSLLFLILFTSVALPAMRQSSKNKARETTLNTLDSVFARDTSRAKYKLKKTGNYLLIRIPDNVTFQQGKYRLEDMQPQGQQILSGIAKRVREDSLTGKIDQIEVVGHTSSEGDNSRNWILSAQRAVTVALYLIEHDGLSPCQVSALGRGRYYPVNPPLAKAESTVHPEDRRIELEITPLVKDTTQVLRRAGCVPEPGTGK